MVSSQTLRIRTETCRPYCESCWRQLHAVRRIPAADLEGLWNQGCWTAGKSWRKTTWSLRHQQFRITCFPARQWPWAQIQSYARMTLKQSVPLQLELQECIWNSFQLSKPLVFFGLNSKCPVTRVTILQAFLHHLSPIHYFYISTLY